jgi:hypothetical protein
VQQTYLTGNNMKKLLNILIWIEKCVEINNKKV